MNKTLLAIVALTVSLLATAPPASATCVDALGVACLVYGSDDYCSPGSTDPGLGAGVTVGNLGFHGWCFPYSAAPQIGLPDATTNTCVDVAGGPCTIGGDTTSNCANGRGTGAVLYLLNKPQELVCVRSSPHLGVEWTVACAGGNVACVIADDDCRWGGPGFGLVLLGREVACVR